MSAEKHTDTTDQSGDWLGYFGWQVPVVILIVTLFGTNLVQLRSLMQQKSQLADSEIQIKQALPRAELVVNKRNALARDIVALAATDANAKQIQDELRIQVAGGIDAPAANAINLGPVSPSPATNATVSAVPASTPAAPKK